MRNFAFARCATGVLAVIAAVTPCISAPVPLSLADTLARAQAHSALVRAADARLRDANARVRGAASLPSTTLSLGHGWGGETGGLDEDILVGQALELPFKVAPRVKAARGERNAAVTLLGGVRQDVEFTATSAYYEALTSDIELALATDALNTAHAFAEAAKTQFDAGDVAKSNVIRAGVEESRARQALDASTAERENRYDSLRSLAGAENGADLTLTDTLTFTPLSFALPALEETALKARPDVIAARQATESKRAGVSAVRMESLPDLVVEERHSTINLNQGASSLRVGVAFPLLDLGRHRADTGSAKAALDEARANLDETVRTARLEVASAARTVEVSRKAVESFKGGRLDRAKELLDMAQTGYQQGATSYLELLDAQQVYRTEQADYARALADYNIAVAALRRAVGGTLP